MRRLVVAGIAAVGLFSAAPVVAPAAQRSPVLKTCSSRFVHAVIGGSHKCLHAGEFCSTANKRQYPRYGFHCVAGRLR